MHPWNKKDPIANISSYNARHFKLTDSHSDCAVICLRVDVSVRERANKREKESFDGRDGGGERIKSTLILKSVEG